MKSMFVCALALASAMGVNAQNPFTTELKGNYNMVKGLVTKAADDMPEGDYGFVPGKNSRTYGAAVVHIAEVQAALCGMSGGAMPPKFDEAKSSKADAQAALKAAFAFCDPMYAAITDADGASMVKGFGGRDISKFGALNFGVIHDNEMYGTLAVYLRAKDKVPPSSAGRGGMGKKKE